MIRAFALAVTLISALAGAAHADSRRGTLIESRESIYNSIFVYDREGLMVMSFGKNDRYWTESVYNPQDDKDLPLRYTRYMTAALAYPAKLRSIAEVGFGGGRTAWYLHVHAPEVPIVSAELDGEVVALATKYFGVREEPNFEIALKDGRLFLARGDDRYDLIMVDAYRGPFVPFHLLTQEFYRTAQDRLTEGGALAQNIDTTTILFDATVKTMASVFDHVDLYDVPKSRNVVAIAYDGPEKNQSDLQVVAKARQTQYEWRYPLPGLIDGRQIVVRLPDVEPLTDDFAPVETMKAVERANAGFSSYTEDPAP